MPLVRIPCTSKELSTLIITSRSPRSIKTKGLLPFSIMFFMLSLFFINIYLYFRASKYIKGWKLLLVLLLELLFSIIKAII
jgi:hypothetical protein